MTKLLVTSLLIAFTVSEAALAHNSMNHTDAAIVGISASTMAFYSSLGSSQTTEQNRRNREPDEDYYKLVAAQEDFTTFLATEGDASTRTAKIEAALEVVRRKAPSLQMSDIQIAREILGL
jgi:Protein of unknown function (DUF2388).